MVKKISGTYLKLSGKHRGPFDTVWTDYTYNFGNIESIEGLNHPGFSRAALGRGDVGGPMFLNRVRHSISPMVFNTSTAQGPYWSDRLTTWSNIPDLTISDSEIITNGTKSIKLTSPTNPTVELSVAVGEVVNDGLPSIIGSEQLKAKTRFLKGSGSEYLNYEFGWLPMMSDLKKLCHAVKDSHDIIHSYRKASDTKIRRRRAFEPVRTYRDQYGGGFLQPAEPSLSYSGAQSESTEIRSWFSGAFRYHVPVDEITMDKLAVWKSNANILLGVRLTPDVVWNLAPWSWAADWFYNTGDILTNIGNLMQDGLVMQYGYQMMHKKKITHLNFWRNSGNSSYKGSGSYDRLQEVKRRIPASPYGFGSTFDGMTSRQKAICAALAITRVR